MGGTQFNNSHRNYGLLLVFVLLAAIYQARDSWAAPAPGALNELQRKQQQIILQQEERLKQQERDFRGGERAVPDASQPSILPHVPRQEGEPCLEVKSVIVSGVTLLSESTVSRLVGPYKGRCLTIADINNLLRDITNEYISRGYITTRAFVDPSASEKGAKEGALHVLVIEGKIEKIIVNEGDKDSYYRGRSAFPFLEGKPLNLRDIEQGIDQLNRLPSASATMELEPGETLGGTVVKVTNQVSKSWRANLGLDNLGQRSTGQGMYHLSLEKDNLMGIGDQFAVYWSEDIPFWDEEIRDRRRIGDNYSLSAFASIPWGYWTFSGNISRFGYNTTVFGMDDEYRSRGITEQYSLKAERVIHRDADSKTSFSGAYNYRSTDSFFEGYRLEASSYNLATAEFGLSHSRRLLGGVAGASVGYIRGLNIFGATRVPDHSHATPQSEFDKYTAMLSYYRPFTIGEQNFYASVTAQGQWSPQTLYGAERIQIGGRYSVRGFHEDSLIGDQGAYVRNEIGMFLPWFESLQTKGPLNGLQLYAAYDAGMLHPDKEDPFERGHVQGVALGIRSIGALALDFTVAKAIDHPSYIRTRDMEIYFSASYTF